MVCDQEQVVVGLLNKTIEVFDRGSLAKVRTLWGHDDHVWSIDMNKEFIVSGSWDSRSLSVLKYFSQKNIFFQCQNMGQRRRENNVFVHSPTWKVTNE